MIVLDYIYYIIGGIGVTVVIWGVIKGIVALLITEIRRFRSLGAQTIELEEPIRVGIGFYLVLGLEFLIAADIIRTILEPSLVELGVLGAIVAIRILLAYFLGREIGHPIHKVD